ncbi:MULTISPECIES: flagellar protein FlgN [unclassified Pantoea]|jgi:flagella synthesis protein FlgN|uniref:flagellar protein FlgN n=1 Tax=unclassified Pantoea TaxID=2630326 RepID=UPI0010C9D2C7|nr:MULTISPECIES: flagellar protein FlgN [unclassified Pantoea]MBY4953639.1 flagellar protein FlgN [Pantoea sp. DY-17]QCP60854.1 flagellar protein FlgN [Pantoea sp. SO10]
MNSTAERVKTLLRDIKQDTQHYDALTALLQQQREAMIACDAMNLQSVNEQLLAIYQQLHGSAQRRSETLQALKLASDSRGISQLMPYLPAALAQQAESWWRTLELSALSCQQMNERNGLLLSMQQETLGSLTGQGQQNFLYQR